MITDNGTDWGVQGDAVIIYHQQEEAPLWLSKEDLEQMIKQLEGDAQ